MTYEVFINDRREMTLDLGDRDSAVKHTVETIEGEYYYCKFSQIAIDRLRLGKTAYVAAAPAGGLLVVRIENPALR